MALKNLGKRDIGRTVGVYRGRREKAIGMIEGRSLDYAIGD